MKTIIEMAREAGFMLVAEPNIDGSDWYECFTEEIESFAELVRADEREACAKMCESYKTASVTTQAHAIALIFEDCIEAIRERGNT